MSKFTNKINNVDLFSKFFLISIITIPILYFTASDYEEYNHGINSTIFLFNNLNNFFSNFNSEIGLGSYFPTGQGLFFYPTSLLSSNLKTFYISTLLLNLFIQTYYFKRILKEFKIFFNQKLLIFLFNFLLIISVPNLAYNYFDNWISIHVSFTIFFPIIYYLVQYQNKLSINSLGKILVFLIIYLYNGHIGHFLQLLIFLFLFVLINKTKIFLNKKYFILLIVFFLIICTPRIYEYLVIYLSYPHEIIDKSIGSVSTYKFSDFVEMLFLPFNYFLRIIDYFFDTNLSFRQFFFNGRELGYGFQLLFSAFIAIELIKKKYSKEIFYIDYIFLIFLFLLCLISIFNFETYLNLSRDIIFILSLIILCVFFYKNTFKYLKFSMIVFLIISNIFLFVESLRHLILNDLSHKILKTDNNEKFKEDLRNLTSTNNEFFRVYLSEKIYEDINDKDNFFFKKNDLMGTKDFNKYNLSIFNVDLKNTPFAPIRKPTLPMHNSLKPKKIEIEDQFLMNFYRIKFLLIYENEFRNISNKNFQIKTSFINNGKKILITENLDFSNYLIVNRIDNNFLCKKYIKLECLKEIKNEFHKNNQVFIKKYSNNVFEILNNNDYPIKLIFPFLHNNYLLKNENFEYIFDSFKILEIPKNEKIKINYLSKEYIFIKSMIILLFFVFLYLNISKIFLRKKFNN